MVVPDFTDEELSLSGDLKVREMPLEAQKSGSPPWRIRKLTLTVTVLLFTNVFLAASTVTLYCFCRDLSHRVYTLETVLQSKTTDIGSTVQSNPKHESQFRDV
ncbi:hypothetical protein CAPTEDRAFT_213759 [Capitella teleta]|uniref:Uncharacterized protein n=1 Tax=Capitella teleta TaxID=283909 RepID=R7UEL1_CAPTE|nr:hypothetical protein CAPTEDRAFT_213759 [Capitella teleta]|eukprot:ELU02223.1 hypothetical protein CAPTEDRAFT_213759 [Capitella teleta]